MALRSWRVWAVTLLAWSLVAAVFGTIRYVYYFERHHLTWGQSIAYSGIDAGLWAVLTPVLIAFGEHFRLDRETWPRLPLHLAVAIVLPVAYWFPALSLTRTLGTAFGHPMWAWELTRGDFVAAYLNNLVVATQILAVSQGLVFHRESRERAARAARLEVELARAQLQLLRMQLEPHFLFNTLHAIATLVHGQPDAAERMIVLLSDLLRRALRERDGHEVALREELAFLDRYLEIEHVRFPGRLHVARAIEDSALDALVPPLLLHPLVENAIRHGLSRRTEGGRMGLEARRRGTRLELRVWDDGAGSADDPTTAGSGIGLANTRARLAQLYGANHAFDLRRGASGRTEVTVSVPFRLHTGARCAS